MKNKILSLLVCLIPILSACQQIPSDYQEFEEQISIYPSYIDVCIPYNIAPLNFHIQQDGSSFVTKIHAKNGKPIVIKGRDVKIPTKEWKSLLIRNKGEKLFVEVYLQKGGTWYKYPTITNEIEADPIDPYIVYRLLQPLYTTYEDISINQRSLENFDNKILYDNRQLSTEKQGQCVNCHSFQDYNRTGKMQMHFRGKLGGTVFVSDQGHQRINTKVEGLISGAVYPSWHPSLNLVAYSVNDIGQEFHTKDLQKTEVLDTKSDLILYDVETKKITKVASDPEWLETFPYWSPDGKYLYYVAAKYQQKVENIEIDIAMQYENLHYDLLRKSFDPITRKFGKTDTMLNAAAIGKSASFPRVSPDGLYLLFTMGDFGNFHIWHKSSDLYLMDQLTGKYRNLKEVNSSDVESYHSWSSNGRWIVFSSRREDGSYTRLYISYFDKNGMAHKPFVLPQKDPLYNKKLFKSYNIPEFIIKPAKTNRHKLARAISKDAEKAVL